MLELLIIKIYLDKNQKIKQVKNALGNNLNASEEVKKRY